MENGSLDTWVIAELGPIDHGRAVLSAMVMDDGTRHVVVEVGSDLRREPSLHHVWWLPGQKPQAERLPGGLVFDRPILRGDGGTLVVTARMPDVSYLYVSKGGAFEAYPFPMNVLSADAREGNVAACASSGAEYLVLESDVADAEPGLPPVWTASPFAASPLAHAAFTCGIAFGDAGLTAVIDSPALFGGGPNPTGGSVAYTRKDVAWESSSIGFRYHAGAGLVAVQGVPVHLGQTANGTSSTSPSNGTELRAPKGGDPMNTWQRFWGNFGGATQFVPDERRLLLVGETWANPPFEYAMPPRSTWAVVEVPFSAAQAQGSSNMAGSGWDRYSSAPVVTSTQ